MKITKKKKKRYTNEKDNNKLTEDKREKTRQYNEHEKGKIQTH